MTPRDKLREIAASWAKPSVHNRATLASVYSGVELGGTEPPEKRSRLFLGKNEERFVVKPKVQELLDSRKRKDQWDRGTSGARDWRKRKLAMNPKA